MTSDEDKERVQFILDYLALSFDKRQELLNQKEKRAYRLAVTHLKTLA